MGRWLLLAGVLVVSLLPCDGVSAPSFDHWIVTGTDQAHYTVRGAGNPLDEKGAVVTLKAHDPVPGKFGASLLVLDATPYLGHRLVLSADLDTRDAAQGALIWLRADGSGGPLAFANSRISPVTGTTSAAHREVRIDVPTEARKIFLGTVLSGAGAVVARHLHLAAGPSVRSSVAAAAMLEAAIGIVRQHALHADRITWSTLEPELRAMVGPTGSAADAYPAIRRLLAALGDHHSHLLPAARVEAFDNAGSASSPPKVEPIPGQLGYIDMPGYEGMQPTARRAFVIGVVDGITRVEPQARCGWVVDLRHNPGGSMLPMLAGLRPLLGDGVLGGFRDAQGKVSAFHAASPLDPDLPGGPALEKAPVAVLLGPRTASSGEVVAIAFRGRPGTRSFGQPTAGLSTGNSSFRLPDGSRIFLTTAVDVDRAGHTYGDRVAPDQPVAAPDSAQGDPTLDAARAWLTAACGVSVSKRRVHNGRPVEHRRQDQKAR